MDREKTGKAGRLLERAKELPNLHRNASIYLGLVALGRIRKIDDLRGIAPDPIDFFNHNGNILSSVTTALAVSAMVSMSERRRNGGAEPKHLKAKVMSAAIASGVAVNALVETRTGLSLPLVECLSDNCVSVSDPIDFAYGVAGAAGGGAMALSMQPEKAKIDTDQPGQT